MKNRSWVAWLRDMVTYVLAMSGIFVREMTPARWLVSVAIAGLTAWSFMAELTPSFSVAVAAFVTGYFVRYLFLFASFTRNGIAAALRHRFGPQRGFELYEAATALQFFYRGVTFSWLVAVTRVTLPGCWNVVAQGAGLVLAVVGTGINLWATDVIGIRSYFYGDLYDGPQARSEFKAVGPYRYLSHPMYGVGQCAGYGAALMALSPVGVLATLVNQLTMYVFTALVEAPHVAAVLRSARALDKGGDPPPTFEGTAIRG
jgi:protein-S-isoprenylcysteine O-methyltransferase Ste14